MELIVQECCQEANPAIKLPCVTDHTVTRAAALSSDDSLQLVGNRPRRPLIAVVDARCNKSVPQVTFGHDEVGEANGSWLHTSWRHTSRDSGQTIENLTPSTRTWSLAVTVSEPICKAGAWLPNIEMLCLEPAQSNSVLAGFICKRFAAIQWPMSSTQ